MKKLILMLLMCIVSAMVMAQGPETEQAKTFLEILTENWKVIGLSLIPVVEIIVKLTPTEKDNSVLRWIFSIFPNIKKGGGVHKKDEK